MAPAEPSPFVDADWIADQVDEPDVCVVELDVFNAAYDDGHIPGAVLWNAYTDLRHPDYTPLSARELEQLLSLSGITPETCVVFYGYAPHLGYWLLKTSGHANLRMMDGSRDKWTESAREWSTEIPAREPTTYALTTPERPTRKDVEAMIGRRDEVILDVRSQLEFDGERFWPSDATEGAGRAGHVPTSVHVPIDLFREDGEFRDAAEIRRALDDAGVTPGQRIVTYCTIGNRACQAWFALTLLLDYPDVDVYYGSWAEWGSLPDTPVEAL
jgi:thiosulfate/3-mercaptopyruvate sulfurtransferase